MIALVCLAGKVALERATAPEPSPAVVRSLRLDPDGDVWLISTEVWPDGEEGWSDSTFLGHVAEFAAPEGLEVEFEALRGQWLEGVEYGRDCRETARAAYERSRGC